MSYNLLHIKNQIIYIIINYILNLSKKTSVLSILVRVDLCVGECVVAEGRLLDRKNAFTSVAFHVGRSPSYLQSVAIAPGSWPLFASKTTGTRSIDERDGRRSEEKSYRLD